MSTNTPEPTYAAVWEKTKSAVDEALSTPPSAAKKRLLLAALEACNGRSIASVSARDIARSAGLNVASLYSHYSGKVELLAAAFTWSYTQFLHRLLTRVEPEREADALISGWILAHLEHDMEFRDSGLLWRDAPDLETSQDPTVRDLRRRVSWLPELYRSLVAAILRENGITEHLSEKAVISVRILNDVDSWDGSLTRARLGEIEELCTRFIRAVLAV